ncbi:MAG: hypothetical protein U0271_45030 [Polyangiaceae bacterium]
MTVREDGFYLVDLVRQLAADRPVGSPWRANEIVAAIDRASPYSGDQERFYLAFLEGLRDILNDDEDAVLTRFMRQAAASEARSLADVEKDRDHLTHVTQVFLVGWFILNSCGKFRTLDDWTPYGWSQRDRFENLNRGWVFTSLLHDCAYSAQNAFQGRTHEARLRAMFGKLYLPGRAGGYDRIYAKELAKRVAARRSTIIDRPVTRLVEQVIEEHLAHKFGPDHAFFTAQALLAEAARHPGPTQELLEVGAVSLWTHNFRHLLRPDAEPSEEKVAWFAVDFWDEPLAALVTVADEIQEWGRERSDNAMTREAGDRPFPSARSVLTELAVDDADGLRIQAHVVHHLFPEDRRNLLRHARTREVSAADDSRTYKNGFKPRVTERTTFHPRLRFTDSVEGERCKVARRYAWPIETDDSLSMRSREVTEASAPTGGSAYLEVHATLKTKPDDEAPLLHLDTSGEVKLYDVFSGDAPIRAVMVAPGGAGKSTILRALARTKKIGRRELAVIFVEELDTALEDLTDLCERERAGSQRDVLLIVDHVDRLLHTPHERYWFEELGILSKRATWLHVIAACRPEEYETVVSFALAGEWHEASLREHVGPLMDTVDKNGRATARGVEAKLRGADEELDRLGQLALSMGSRRFLERPKVTTEAQFAGESVLTFTHGRVRFVHDAVQDYLSAWALARNLAHEEGETMGGAVRRLLHTPPDVLRMLLGVLSTSRRLQREGRRRAARGFAAGLLREATLRHWLYDTGYLARARENVEEFVSMFADDPDIYAIGQMLLGLLEYSEFSPTQVEPGRGSRSERDAAHETLERAVVALATALAHFDRVPVDPPAWGGKARDVEVATMHTADHLVTLLARVSALVPGPTLVELKERALALLSDANAGSENALTAGWVRTIIKGIDPNGSDPIAPLVRMDEALTRHMSDPEGRRRFALRSFQLAGHIGGTLFLYKKHDAASLREGERWQEGAVTRVGRVLRDMEDLGHHEHFGSRAHGLMDGARALAAIVFFKMVALEHGTGAPTDAKYAVLEAFDRYERARKRARLALRPEERLTIANWHGMQDQVFGGVFKKAFYAGGMSVEKAESALKQEEKEVLDENRRFAQKNPRSKNHKMLEYIEARIGNPAEFIAKHARPSGNA